MIEQRAQLDVTALTEYLAAQPDVIAAYLFGSRASGRARAGSDVDVAVLLDEEEDVAAGSAGHGTIPQFDGARLRAH